MASRASCASWGLCISLQEDLENGPAKNTSPTSNIHQPTTRRLRDQSLNLVELEQRPAPSRPGQSSPRSSPCSPKILNTSRLSNRDSLRPRCRRHSIRSSTWYLHCQTTTLRQPIDRAHRIIRPIESTPSITTASRKWLHQRHRSQHLRKQRR